MSVPAVAAGSRLPGAARLAQRRRAQSPVVADPTAHQSDPMAVFPSPEWFDAFCRELARHPSAPRIAEALDGVYRFVVEPAGPVSERHSYDVSIGVEDTSPQIRRLPDPVDQPRLTVTATFDRWRQLIQGEMGLAMAVMLRRVRVAGDLAGLQRRMSDTQPLADALQQVETTWPQDHH